MPKKHRLTHADFASGAQSRSRRLHGTYFSLAVSRDPGATLPRAACIVSKKVAAHASDRNLIRRRCREALRKFLANTESPLILVFHAKREVLDASYAHIARDVENLIKRVDSAA